MELQSTVSSYVGASLDSLSWVVKLILYFFFFFSLTWQIKHFLMNIRRHNLFWCGNESGICTIWKIIFKVTNKLKLLTRNVNVKVDLSQQLQYFFHSLYRKSDFQPDKPQLVKASGDIQGALGAFCRHWHYHHEEHSRTAIHVNNLQQNP